ncbi:hypothetical protein K450DRAFT_264032 [Umbelopsis ramanniana AG]|uniref:Uncharacterized protein n=1 Tax=Umbelopsis ramanniana AG TaxID=1314678 RepID=A0AAD5H9V8_UMBRA|nr:uncharacterized protein K450DRAFT_264032 [Umbelopsis ramanniana AG]KAI8574936.1 hypothetical protein K450DRAFT_264032 [Umbelopsis ramanniana AG]
MPNSKSSDMSVGSGTSSCAILSISSLHLSSHARRPIMFRKRMFRNKPACQVMLRLDHLLLRLSDARMRSKRARLYGSWRHGWRLLELSGDAYGPNDGDAPTDVWCECPVSKQWAAAGYEVYYGGQWPGPGDLRISEGKSLLHLLSCQLPGITHTASQ